MQDVDDPLLVGDDSHTLEGRVAGSFEITKDKVGKCRFRLKSGNGEIIAVSEAYATKASAENGIESVQKNAPDATVVDLTE